MVRSFLIVAASLAALLFLPAHGLAAAPERWVAIEESDDGTMFFDRESAQRTGAIVRFTMRLVNAVPDQAGASGALLDHEIDCAAQTIAILRGRTFGSRGETLRTLEDDRPRPHPMFVNEPGHDALYRLVCPDGRPLPEKPAVPASTQRPATTTRD